MAVLLSFCALSLQEVYRKLEVITSVSKIQHVAVLLQMAGSHSNRASQKSPFGLLTSPVNMSHPEFLGNLSSRKKVKHPKRKGLGKEDLLGYTVENQHDRQGQEVNPIDAVQV